MKLLIFIFLLLTACRTPKGTAYPVRKVEFIAGRTYRVTSDSFTVDVRIKGLGKYRPTKIFKP